MQKFYIINDETLKQIIEMIKYLHICTRHFPSHEKYVLSQSLHKSALNIYEQYVSYHKKFHKKSVLDNLDLEHEKLRMFVHLAHEMGYFSYKNGRKNEGDIEKFLRLSEKINTLGRKIGYLRKQISGNEN